MDLDMVNVPGGHIELHDARSQRRWSETVPPFALARYPTTMAQHVAVLGGPTPSAAESKLPAVDVSWLDAVDFCNALSRLEAVDECYEIRGEDVRWDRAARGYRLPTEAEWELACRAGTSGPHYGPLGDIAWFEDNAEGALRLVQQKAPNAFGLHDMLGNVWEWCWDRLDPERYLSYRTFRGGGWSDPAYSCRASTRRGSHPTFHIDDLGFRLARSL